MKTDKQKLLIEYLLSSPDIFTLTNTITQHKFFEPEFRNTIKFIKDYYEKYQALPDLPQLKAETGIDYEVHSMTKDKIEYCVYEVENFCKEKAMFHAILDSAELLDKGKPGEIEKLIKEALTTGVYRSVGTDFFEDPSSWLEQIVQDEPISTGYKLLDQYLGGGVRRKEFVLLAAQSGGGKSVVKANLGLNFIQQGLNVLYISLELPVPMINKRYASMMTGIAQKDIESNRNEVAVRINSAKKDMGGLYIEQMPIGTTTNQLRAFMKEFELKRKCVPDVLIIDYLDLMGTNQGISADNIFQKEKVAAEEVRQLALDFNMVLLASSQLNRSACDAKEFNHSHLSGSLGKIFTVDIYFAIVFSDIQRQQGEMAFQLLKTRSSDGVGKFVQVRWNASTLRISDPQIGPTGAPVQKFAITNNEIKGLENDRKSKLMEMFGGLD